MPFNLNPFNRIERKLDNILRGQQYIMATQTELAEQLTEIKTNLTEAFGELSAKITALEEALANAGQTTPEVDAALADVKTIATTLKDIVP